LDAPEWVSRAADTPLYLTCMETIRPFLLAHPIEGRSRRAEKREGTQPELGAQIARQHIHE